MHRRRRSGSSVMIAAVIMLTGFQGIQAQRPAVVDNESPTDSVLVAHFRTLRFLRDHVSSDERPLDWTHRARREIARLEPEASMFSDTSGGGRVLARIVNLGVAVPRFALVRGGTTYIWIQDDRQPAYAVYISTNSNGQIVGRERVELLPYDSTTHLLTFSEPIARWRSSPAPAMRAAALCLGRCKTGPWCSPDSVRATRMERPRDD